MKKLLKRFKESKKGFSLVELIVVIAIMAILVGVLGVTFIPYIEKSREGVDIDTLGKIKSVVEPALLTAEDVSAYEGKATELSTLTTAFPIIGESLPNSTAPKCNCIADDAKVYVYLNDNQITVFYSEDGDKVFAGTKDGMLLSTDQSFTEVP